ncbi:MAG: TPM domain-containing protein [Ruminococcaceae bacterium]|nr:TPM domain-containing protein [Oscillospiraceae bacterium]
MKKILITVIFSLALLLILPISAFADTGKYVVDNGNLLDTAEETALEEKLEAISNKYDFDVVALTVSADVITSESNAEAYADDYYDYNDYKNDGCLLLISEDHYWHISTKGYGITAITDYGIDVLSEDVVYPYFGNEDWNGGFNAYADLIDSFVSQAKSGEPYDVDNTYTNESGYTYSFDTSDEDDDDVTVGSFIISFIVAIIIAAVITGMVKSGYKPVRFKASAADYLVDGSLHITGEYDRFLYSNVTKTKIERSSSSSGGSSTHTSSSGSSHGGGGGRF